MKGTDARESRFRFGSAYLSAGQLAVLRVWLLKRLADVSEGTRADADLVAHAMVEYAYRYWRKPREFRVDYIAAEERLHLAIALPRGSSRTESEQAERRDSSLHTVHRCSTRWGIERNTMETTLWADLRTV